DYAAEISRHPGRRVDVEVAPGPRAGTTAVNLRITESKPWYVYAQYANTGTSTTTKNRERFGFTHNQLTGRDDILSLDYTTGDFDEVHAASAAYAAPFDLSSPEWRFALGGGYSQFDAREAGIIPASEVEGEDANAGGEISRQLFQHHELFVDAAVGARWQHIEVENRQFPGAPLEAEVNYAVPHADLRLVRNTTTSALRARLGVLGGWSDTRDSDVDFVFVSGQTLPVKVFDVLGNQNADDDFALTTLDASWSFYLEPLIDPHGWRDPDQKKGGTLAHEVALLARGQWAMDYRLVPQFQQVAGGFTTVRGYKQSAVVGDHLALGSAEYRLHLPRLFSPDPSPPELPGMGVFRLRPAHLWDVPDWDLIFRIFGDVAYVASTDALASEEEETLASTGGGVELAVRRNLTVRVDVGHTLGSTHVRGNG
ncbi:MAG: ShlB/FhaC/HecB family hemolysin secretion/activation protein, partial [Myxococcota bacterium]